jgi:hypothetical protein
LTHGIFREKIREAQASWNDPDYIEIPLQTIDETALSGAWYMIERKHWLGKKHLLCREDKDHIIAAGKEEWVAMAS